MKPATQVSWTAPALAKAPKARRTMPLYRIVYFLAVMILSAHTDIAAASSGGDSGSGEMDTMVALVPMPIAIIHQAKVKGILMVEFYLEAPNVAEVDRINQLMPRLMDAYRTGLNQFAAHELRLDRPVNLDRLDLYLNRETRTVLGNKGVRVIFRQVMVQRR